MSSARVTPALTLRTYPYSEAHRIAVFLTPRYGKVRAMVYGARRARKNALGSALEPLTHLNLTFTQKENSDLGVLKNCEIVQAFPAYKFDLEMNLHFGYFAELLGEFCREGEAAEKAFRLALAVLEGVGRSPVHLLARYLELWLLQLEGVLPRPSDHLPTQLSARTHSLMRCHPAELEVDTLSSGEVKRLERWAQELIECHLEKHLKTRKMLKELL